MLIYILHKEEFFTFRLPKNVEGSFILSDNDNNGFKRSLINVVGIDSKWIMKSNDSFRILYNNQYVESIELLVGVFYTLISSSGEQLLLYVALGNDNTYTTKRFNGNGLLTVGGASDCDIVLLAQIFAPKIFQLKFENGLWIMTKLDKNSLVYVNGKAESNKILNNFDSIFVNGFNIVVCADLLFVNDPYSCVHYLQQNFIEVQNEYCIQNIDTSDKSYVDFYESSEYFLKSPIFLKKIKTLELTITSPEEKEKANDSSLLMSIVPSALMSLSTVISAYFSISNYNKGSFDKEGLITTLVMCAVMVFIAIVWPFIERFAERIKLLIGEFTRNRQYRKYLKKKREILDSASKSQKMTLQFNNLSLIECQEIIRKRSANLFSSGVEHQNFLTVRLGEGKVKLDCNIDYSKPDFIKVKDNLLNVVDKLIEEYKYIDSAPYIFSLKNNIAFIQSNGNYDGYLNSIVLQLLTFNDYYNLKLIVFTNEHSSLNKIRNLNHLWDNDRETRFFATDIREAEVLSSYLIRIYNSRMENNDSSKSGKKTSEIPHYLIICDDIDRYRNLNILEKVLHQKEENCGFSLVMFSLKISDVPDGCSYFVDYNEEEATLFESEMDENSIMKFKPELIDSRVNFNDCVKCIANIPIKNNNETAGVLPEKVGFLEMYNVGTVEQLNSVGRWKNAQVINTLAAPIGYDANGNVLSLDLHEKNHGPHGLIAGMTGSGKSEFIITYILSLAVSYSPNEVQFVLIDYKGGGLAGAFENRKTGVKLPHLVGTITNLDKSSMHRTLVSIKSELQRRQRVFNEAKEQLNSGTIDIYKYQKLVREGTLKEYMSHLFIICDEFAELKAQQPDFMDELVSAARIGRSLGIHLILATQKPSGVVDDQIWSNSKFKVCCKVQTAEDSKEMIRRDDAAFIKESGRFYLQVGYDEIFVKGQSAYTGTLYVPSESVRVANKGKDSVEFINNLGNVILSTKKEDSNSNVANVSDLGDELGNVLNYLIKSASEIGFVNKQLWLDNIPENVYLYDLYKKYPVTNHRFVINPLIGEYDDPQNQKQGPVHFNITEKGNLWISGAFGGGKTTLMSTMIYSSIVNYSTEELNIYIVDLLAESLRIFADAPQVGDFVSSSEPIKLNKLFHYLTKEVSKRKKHYSTTGGTFVSDCIKGKSRFPNIVVFLNGVDIFTEQYDELYENIFTPLVRDCNRVGIYFVISSTGSLNVAVENCFSQKIAMRYLDSSEYSVLFNDTRGIIPASNPGRGLVELDCVYEFQVSLIFPDNSFEYNLSYVISQLREKLPKANSIPEMPVIVRYDSLKDEISTLDSVPIGIELSSNFVYNYDFTKLINLILYSNQKMAVSFEAGLVEVMSKLTNVKIIILDALEFQCKVDGIQIFNSNFKKVCEALLKNIKEKFSKTQANANVLFFISGYTKINSHLKKMKVEDESVITIDDLITASVGATNFKFILVDDIQFKNIDDKEWSDYLDVNNGIVLGSRLEEQEIFDIEDSYDDIKLSKDTATAINERKKSYVKFVRGERKL